MVAKLDEGQIQDGNCGWEIGCRKARVDDWGKMGRLGEIMGERGNFGWEIAMGNCGWGEEGANWGKRGNPRAIVIGQLPLGESGVGDEMGQLGNWGKSKINCNWANALGETRVWDKGKNGN
ncbi:hypothetical protein Gasu2_37910 [Galdieria sulphuraria]|uniref:Uncharacterized protein n=1 Tax=Galdieria sulphuraria TaxID=130081 RepID=M2XRH5_GALSU|nr:uncharacterized protein Gasu_60880 [Galdieria sulphuraria]EME26273.1 hypothetical protein Gasu_60880 [Galdieria sulphuraria]GJD07952.1 hypothetical protein Gasu2_22710 [Galdieria sulphuraria]GJD09545.1 hypothetical protein Gasu2_37910 [Galdieria sulphuraria]|eukprot:XP_005702793.1 hypothetical protein Gasu_60880 [Galdieria sulphuraria]